MKRVRVYLSGARKEQLERFHANKHQKLANRVLFQVIEGMLRLELLDDHMAFNISAEKPATSSEKSLFQFTLREDKYPFLYQQYLDAEHGGKELLISSYIFIALGFMESENSEAAIKRYIREAKKPTKRFDADSTGIVELLPAAPMPDDELAEIEENAKKTQNATEPTKTPEPTGDVSDLDDIEDLSVFDDLDDLDDSPATGQDATTVQKDKSSYIDDAEAYKIFSSV